MSEKLTQEEMDRALGVDVPAPDLRRKETEDGEITPAIETNLAIKERLWEYMLGVCQNAATTISLRKERFIVFDRWLAAKLPEKSYLDLTKDDIRNFVKFQIDKGDAPSTIQTTFAGIKTMYYFLTDEEGILDKNPCPSKARVRSKRHHDTLIKFADLMQVRENANYDIGTDHLAKSPGRRNTLSSLRRYTAFEVLLSTGMSVGELNRITANDINWNDKVEDRKLKKMSPYVHGSITLNPQELGVKKRRFRKVYLGYMAAKLLKLHLYHHGITGAIPVFPWPTKTIENWMRRLAVGVLKERKRIQDKQGKPVIRTAYKTEVHIDPNSKVSSEVVNAIRKQQARAALREDYEIKAEYKYEIKTTSLHPHALRHVFSCAMMFRDWRGDSHDTLHVKRLLGHNPRSIATNTYLDHVEYLATERQWVQLFGGTPKSYWRLFHLLTLFDPASYVKKAALHHKKGSKYNP